MLKAHKAALRQVARVCSKSILLCSASLMVAGAAHAQSATQARTGVSEDTSHGDIVVTARRREESIQRVPVAVIAISAEQIQQRGIQTTSDLEKLVPGVIFNGGGTPLSPTFTIRGQGRDVIGAALPSVITYLNEVPLAARGSVIPTFDVANVQILKGPQGTLFGRNTTGGAVLYYTQAPTYELGGYAQGTLGNYSWLGFEGAVNVPIMADKLAIRVAGQVQSRKGYTKNMSGWKDQDNLNSRAYRVSVLAEPVEGIKNTTVFDYFWSRDHGNGILPVGSTGVPVYKFDAAAFGPFLGPLITAGFNCTTSIDCNVDQQLARQAAAGPRKVWTDPSRQPFNYARVWGITNTTQIDLGNVSVKNIFAYRISHTKTGADTDGMTNFLLGGEPTDNTKQISEELQVSGKVFGDKLNYLFGAFYLKNSPDGQQVLPVRIFSPAGFPVDSWPLNNSGNALYTDETKALFASFSYEIVSGLKFNASFRHTWDKESICGYSDIFSDAGRSPSLAACKATVAKLAAGQPAGAVGTAGAGIDKSARFQANTWNLGIDYQATPDVFVYGVARRGYRAGNFNTPALGGRLAPFQTYKPQFVTDFEVGVKTDWRMGEVRGRVNIAAFHSKFSKLQQQISSLVPNFDQDNNPTNDPTGTSVVVNGGKSRVNGIEVSGYIAPVPALSIDYGLSYVDAKFIDLSVPPLFSGNAGAGGEFNNTPKWSYSVQGRYELPVKLAGGDIAVRASYYWVDNYVVGAFQFPSHHTVDAAIDINHIGNSGLNLTFFADNLTNETYFQNGVLTGLGLGVFASTYAPPRMYGVRARYNF